MKVEITLRDLECNDYDKWVSKNCPTLSCCKCPFQLVHCDIATNNCWIYHKDMFSDKFLNQTIKITKRKEKNK